MRVFKWFLLLSSLCSIFCFFFYPAIQKNQSIQAKIQQIPIEDRWAIETFFRILLLKDGGAYTLFSDKPVTFDSYFDASSEEITSSSRKYCLENRQLRKGWETWMKYQHLFQSNAFLLKACPTQSNKMEIVLVNKSNLIKTIDEHLVDFQEVIGEKVSATGLLKRYEIENVPFFDLLKHHHGLLGTSLGFGRTNAWLFQKRDRVQEHPQRFTIKTTPLPSSEFKTVEEERAYYQNNLTGAFSEKNHRKAYKFLYLPGFIVDPDSKETQELQKKYVQQRERIHEIYSHGDFLEITLRRFCGK